MAHSAAFGSRTISLVFTVLAAYCGAYYYINTHPAFFVFAYAPWILLAAIGWLDLQSKKNFRWGLVWLFANFACFNAGHVELAVVLIGGLNSGRRRSRVDGLPRRRQFRQGCFAA
jgi:hypothetical protein